MLLQIINSLKRTMVITQMIGIAEARDDIRSIVIYPAMIYNKALVLPFKIDQLPKMNTRSRIFGKRAYMVTDLNCWSNVHIVDLASLYHPALEKSPFDILLLRQNGNALFVEIATSISNALGFGRRTQSWSADDAIAELDD